MNRRTEGQHFADRTASHVREQTLRAGFGATNTIVRANTFRVTGRALPKAGANTNDLRL